MICRSITRVTAVCLTAALCSTPAQAQDHPLIGIYTAEQVEMVLIASGPGAYQGRFAFAGETHPFEATAALAGQGLQGRTLVPGEETPFEALLMGDLLVVGDGAQTLFLQRSSQAVSDELAARIAADVYETTAAPAPAATPAQLNEAGMTAPVQPPPTPDSPAASAWLDKMWNARLTYMYSYYSGGVDGAYVGASEETTIDLCGKGFFRYGSSGFFSVDGGGGASYNAAGGSSSREQGQGVWEVASRGGDVVLRLRFHDGSATEYVLSTDDEGKGTYLNGQRYYRTYAHSPIEEYRPTCPA